MEYDSAMAYINYLNNKYGHDKALDIISQSEENLNKLMNKLNREPIELKKSQVYKKDLSLKPNTTLNYKIKQFATFKLSELGSIIAKIISAVEEKEYIAVCKDKIDKFKNQLNKSIFM